MATSNVSPKASELLSSFKQLSAAGALTDIDWRNLENAALFYGRRAGRSLLAAQALRVGSRAEFTHSKTGTVIVGTIERINAKSVSLVEDVGFRSWSVAPSLLRATQVPAPPPAPGLSLVGTFTQRG